MSTELARTMDGRKKKNLIKTGGDTKILCGYSICTTMNIFSRSVHKESLDTTTEEPCDDSSSVRVYPYLTPPRPVTRLSEEAKSDRLERLVRENIIDKSLYEKICRDNQESERVNEAFVHRNLFRSCCFELDRRVLVFTTQFIISLLVLIMAAIQIEAIDSSCEAKSPWISLVAAVLGFWLPQPTIS